MCGVVQHCFNLKCDFLASRLPVLSEICKKNYADMQNIAYSNRCKILNIESFGRRDEPEPGPSACSGVESTWSSSLRPVLRASAGVRVVRRTRDRLPGRRKGTSDRRPRSSSGDPFSCIAFVPGREPRCGSVPMSVLPRY